MPKTTFIDMAAKELGLTLRFEGEGVDERAIVVAIGGDMAPALRVGQTVVRIDPRYFRPTEVETLLGDPSKARECLGWQPEITAQQMCSEMVRSDLQQAQKLALLRRHGFNAAVSTENGRT